MEMLPIGTASRPLWRSSTVTWGNKMDAQQKALRPFKKCQKGSHSHSQNLHFFDTSKFSCGCQSSNKPKNPKVSKLQFAVSVSPFFPQPRGRCDLLTSGANSSKSQQNNQAEDGLIGRCPISAKLLNPRLEESQESNQNDFLSRNIN